MKRATIFGISGCTNAGKTTISNHLIARLKAKNFLVAHVCQDAFFKTPDKVRQVPSNVADVLLYHYDEPSAVDEDGMVDHIKGLSKDNDVIVVEGNMLSELPNVAALLDEIVFFTMTKEECRTRRSTRNYDPPDGPGYFDQIVWPSYEAHYDNALRKREGGQDIAFECGTQPLQNIMEKVFSMLEATFKDLIRIQNDEIATLDAESFVNLPSCGAISTFVGTTRDNFGGKSVRSLEYECYEGMAYSEMKNVCSKTREKYPAVKRIAIIHRIGKVDIGQASVVIATSSPHRREAIEATHFAIDLLKETVPIFKREIYSDGTKSWKENGEFKDLKGKLQGKGGCGDCV